MRKILTFTAVASLLAAVALSATLGREAGAQSEAEQWSADFSSEKPDLVSTGRNPYFVLEPGYVLELKDGNEELTITVKDETKMIDGVECRVLEELETKNGKITERSNNYFAISKRTNSVYYFGEDTGGAWLSGEKGARFGLLMPGLPLIGARYYQEIAPKVAMDRARVVSTSETVATPAGTFTQVLKVEETDPLEPGTKEFKYYAPGVGLIQEESFKLVSYGKK